MSSLRRTLLAATLDGRCDSEGRRPRHPYLIRRYRDAVGVSTGRGFRFTRIRGYVLSALTIHPV